MAKAKQLCICTLRNPSSEAEHAQKISVPLYNLIIRQFVRTIRKGRKRTQPTAGA